MEDNHNDIEAFKAKSQARAEQSAADVGGDEYEAKMLEAFVGKPDNPDKGLWYATAFSKFEQNGGDVMRWQWSWWAFFGGIWFLLYRKAYAAAGTLFLIAIVSSFIPYSGLIVGILAGGFSPYFVYRVYKAKKRDIEQAYADESERIEMMWRIGGYNAWAAWVLPVLIVLGIMTAILIPQMADQDMNGQPTYEQKIENFERQYQKNLEEAGQ